MNRVRQPSWKGTNLALIGSELDRKIKAAAAEGEPQWTGIGQKEELRVWRIEQFRVKAWPKTKYGSFHTGDSYVVLHTYKPDPTKPKLAHDIHIWIGEESTQDEYGTAAYKMVECDDKLGGVAVQHREVQYKESSNFLGYFNKKIIYLEGGVDSGFRHFEQAKDLPHLYRIKGTRHNGVALTQIYPVRRDKLNAGDVFVLHVGSNVWQWNGKECNSEERRIGNQVARGFASKGNVKVLDQDVNDSETEASEFWVYLPGTIPTMLLFKRTLNVKSADNKDDSVKVFTPKLYEIEDSTNGKFKLVSKAKVPSHKKRANGNNSGEEHGTTSSTTRARKRIKRTKLQPKHAYCLDTGFEMFVWTGSQVDAPTKVASMNAADRYFEQHKDRPILPVTLVKENQSLHSFDCHFYDPPPKKSSMCAIM